MSAKPSDLRPSDLDFPDIDALAALLKSRRAQRLFQTALKKGQSPTLSLTAAISASLVSAAAEETQDDPLAGLTAVDDLSAFAEDCLPGASYAEAAGHDHDGRGDGADHAGHYGASYLDDPFASRFESPFKSAHADHDRHDASGGDHCAAPLVASAHGAHAASHEAQGHDAHSGGHEGHGAAHDGHDVTAAASGHAHGAVHDGVTHKAHETGAHGAHGAEHASAHAGHSMSDMAMHMSHDGMAMDGHSMSGGMDGADLDELADAMPDDHGMQDMTPDMETDASADDAQSDHGHATLAEMNMPPAEDLSTVAMAPMA